MYLYIASSWRNTYYPEVVTALRKAGHEVYDFRNPPTDTPSLPNAKVIDSDSFLTYIWRDIN